MSAIVLNFFALQAIPSAFLFNGVKQTGEMTILSYSGVRLSATQTFSFSLFLLRLHCALPVLLLVVAAPAARAGANDLVSSWRSVTPWAAPGVERLGRRGRVLVDGALLRERPRGGPRGDARELDGQAPQVASKRIQSSQAPAPARCSQIASVA